MNITRRTIAALLLAVIPTLAAASCFVHPDTGRTHCTTAAECPAGTIAWDAGTQACIAPQSTPAPTGTSGVYTPSGYVMGAAATAVDPQRAMWTRTGNMVTVFGTLHVTTSQAGGAAVFLQPPIPATLSDQFGLVADASAAGTLTTESGRSGLVRGTHGTVVMMTYIATLATLDIVKYSYTYEVR